MSSLDDVGVNLSVFVTQAASQRPPLWLWLPRKHIVPPRPLLTRRHSNASSVPSMLRPYPPHLHCSDGNSMMTVTVRGPAPSLLCCASNAFPGSRHLTILMWEATAIEEQVVKPMLKL